MAEHPPILGFSLMRKVRVHIVLALVQVLFATFQLMTKIGFNHGLNKSVYPIYRNIIGSLVLLPFSETFERKDRPKLNVSYLLHFFFLGLSAVAFGQGLYLYGLFETTPTFASAFQNSIPALTFVIAAVSRVEDVNLRRKDGQAKLLGAIFAGFGATLMTIYKGPLIVDNGDSIVHLEPRVILTESAPPSSSLLGSIYLVVSCIGFAIYYVLQAKTLRIFPAKISTVFFTNFFGAVQLALFNLATNRNISSWRISGGYQIVAVLYAGLVASGLVFSMQAWCMQQAGPVIVSAYQPLQTVVVAIFSLIFMGESFYLGGVLGAILIVLGLYLVTWGQEKHKEHIVRQNSLQAVTQAGVAGADAATAVADEEDKLESGLNQPLLKS